jgi:serine/threonine-protein kinase
VAKATNQLPERFGPFMLLRELGVGGMGAAYLATHVDTGSLLVVKRMHPEFHKEPVIFKRFVHEAEVAAHVRHPNVASLVAMGTTDGEPFLATEYVFGIQVSQVIERIETAQIDPIPLPVALHLIVDLAAGLEAIHSAVHRETGEPLGLIHRDIGSRNVLIGFDGQIRIIDLGLGKSVLADWQTASQVLAGSPDYMPPEQAMGARVDGRADIYSAAVTSWELLAGKKRIREEGVAARLTRAIQAQPEPLIPFRPDAPKRLEAVLKRSMDADPDQRTPTAQIFLKALKEELAHHGKKVTKREVAAWLDSACATVIAREKRLLAEARARLAGAKGQDVAKTMLLVGAEEGAFSLASPYDFYGDGERSSAPQRNIITTPDDVTKDAVKRQSGPIKVVASYGASPERTKLALGVLSLLILCAIVTLTVLLVRPRNADVQVIGLPEATHPTGTTIAATAKPTEPAPPELEPDPPGSAEIDGEEEQEPSDDAKAETRTHPAQPEPSQLSPELAARKSDLIRRIRSLRRQRFDVAFQRKVTQLSLRLSHARSTKSLDELESALVHLEAER